jgi:hypothetical protein
LSAEDQPEGIQVPVVWAGIEDAPIAFTNTFLCQFDLDQATFLLTFGQLTPPAFAGTPEEVAEQAENIEFVQIKPIARLSLSEARFRELIAVLQANVDQLERARTMRPGDPR